MDGAAEKHNEHNAEPLASDPAQVRVKRRDKASRAGNEDTSTLKCTHDTEDGLIDCEVLRLTSHLWLAYYFGSQLEGGTEKQTAHEAKAAAIEAFSQMFPEHVCNECCETWARSPVSKQGMQVRERWREMRSKRQ